MIELDNLQFASGAWHEDIVEELTAERRYCAVKQLKNSDLFVPTKVLTEKPCTLILDLACPDSKAVYPLIVSLRQGVNNGF